MTRRLILPLGASVLAFVGLTSGTAAQAEGGTCPPGMYPVGGIGWSSCAPIPGAGGGSAAPNYPIAQDATPSWARGASIDPLAGRIEAATTLFQLEAQRTEQLQRRLASDPAFAAAYQRYLTGSWDFFRQSPSAPPGEHCAALFLREGRGVMLAGPGGDYRGTLLVFLGKEIPRPAKPGKISVTLNQTESPPQTVKAFTYQLPGSDWNAIALAIPSVADLLDNMLDRHDFSLSLKGREIFTIGWTSGNTARDRLRQCLATSPR